MNSLFTTYSQIQHALSHAPWVGQLQVWEKFSKPSVCHSSQGRGPLAGRAGKKEMRCDGNCLNTVILNCSYCCPMFSSNYISFKIKLDNFNGKIFTCHIHSCIVCTEHFLVDHLSVCSLGSVLFYPVQSWSMIWGQSVASIMSDFKRNRYIQY